jgi:hypothetical protein
MKLKIIIYLYATDIIKSNTHISYANSSSCELGAVEAERASYVVIEFRCHRTVDVC